jgi:hypothetical protein
MEGGYNTKEKSKRHVTGKTNYIPEQMSLLAHGNKGGQPEAGGITVRGKKVIWRQ